MCASQTTRAASTTGAFRSSIANGFVPRPPALARLRPELTHPWGHGGLEPARLATATSFEGFRLPPWSWRRAPDSGAAMDEAGRFSHQVFAIESDGTCIGGEQLFYLASKIMQVQGTRENPEN